MNDTAWHEEIGRRAATLQIVTGALLVGSLGFLGVAAVLVHLEMVEPQHDLAGVMNLVLLVFLAAEIVARLVVPGMIVAQARSKIAAGTWTLPEAGRSTETASLIERTGDAGRLLVVYQTRTIVAAALLEGVALFAIIVYMLTHSLVGLAIAILLILGLVFHIPSRSGVVHWVENQLQLVDQQRQRP